MSSLPSRPAGSNWLVRGMRGDDLPAVARIERDIYEFPWTEGNFSDSIVAGYDCWVFATPGRIDGYAVLMWTPDEVHLLNLSVAGDRQGRGQGRSMLEWLLANVARRGAARIMLEVRPSNTIARHLYESFGFRQIGVRKRYYPAAVGRREDALVLLRGLGDQARDRRGEIDEA